jgi:hypothetical protein
MIATSQSSSCLVFGALALLGASLLPRATSAADPPDDTDRALPCRPTIACTADFARPGTFEVEAGWSAMKQGNERVTSFPFLLKQTFTPMLQLQVGSNGFTALRGATRTNYLDDIVVGPKLHLRDQSDYIPSLALSAEIGVPTFRATGYARNDDAFFDAYASKDFGPVHADLNAGVTVWQLETASLQEAVELALSGTLAGPLGALVEGYYFSNAAPVAPRDGGVRGALTLTPRPWLVFDAGGDVGFFPSTRAFTLFVGMTVVPVVLWRRGPK